MLKFFEIFEFSSENFLTRGLFRVARLAPSGQFVSLFSLFLRPRRVFWVECYFDEVAFRGFLWIPIILTNSDKFGSFRQFRIVKNADPAVVGFGFLTIF